MPRHAVKLFATMGACSVFVLALSSGAGAVEINAHVNIPHINVPKPHVNVPTVNLQHHRQSTGTNTLTNNNKLNATTTTVNTPFVGPSNGARSPGAKIIIESVGGSATPSGVEQQNAAAAAAAAAIAGTSGAGSPGGPNIPPAKAWNPSQANTVDGFPGPGQTTPVVGVDLNDIPPPYGSAAYYNYLTGGGENTVFAADEAALVAAINAVQNSASCENDPQSLQCSAALQAAFNARNAFQTEINYLLHLLALTQDTAWNGLSWTPQETALIEAAITACVDSPSTCAATITNLNAELAGLGVPTVFVSPFGAYPEGGATIQVLSTPAQIVAVTSPYWGPVDTLSYEVGYWTGAFQFDE